MRTGRRPKRSDNAPSNGPNRNCISAQVVPNRPKTSAPLAVSPPTKLTTSPGSTGIMMPNPRVSKRTVANMNARAALLAPVFDTVSTLGGSWVSSVKLCTLFWSLKSMRLLPNEEPQILASGTSGSLEDVVSTLTVIPIVLFMICGLFSGIFIVALLFRRIVIALAVAGPLVFSAIWIWRDWEVFRNKQIALGAFAVGFTLTFLALDREP